MAGKFKYQNLREQILQVIRDKGAASRTTLIYEAARLNKAYYEDVEQCVMRELTLLTKAGVLSRVRAGVYQIATQLEVCNG